MIMTRFKLCTLFGVVLISAACLASQPKSPVYDPIFGLGFDPVRTHFEHMPRALEQQCAEFHGHYVDAWVFGHLKTSDAEYYLIYGTIKVSDEEHPDRYSTIVENGEGYMVELSGRGCLVDGAYDIFFPASTPQRPQIKISESCLTTFAANIIERYASAFGKAQFLNIMSRQKRLRPDLYHQVPPVILKQFELYEKKSGRPLGTGSKQSGAGDRRSETTLDGWPVLGNAFSVPHN
jgi:hypothetical protein